MKHFLKSAICLAVALALNANARADDIALSGNPYTMVVERNVFGLVSPPPPDTTPPPAAPPVRITPNGITDILGQVQVLFKVSGSAPGKEDSYILSEGQGQDDIEVVKIDEKKGVVTFNNHGLTQEIPLSAASAGSAPAAGSSAIPMPGFAPGVNPAATGFGRAFGSRIGNYGGNVPGGADSGSSSPAVPIRVNPVNQQPVMSPEEQVIGFEINREMTKQQVIEGTMPPYPPTPITPDDATGEGGIPLVPPPVPSE